MKRTIAIALLAVAGAAPAARAQLVIVEPPHVQPQNPVIYAEQQPGHWYYCHRCCRYHYRQGDQTVVHHSATDPNRGQVDPGSLRYVDQWVWTPNGWARRQGRTWTSNGVYHDTITQTNPDGSQVTSLRAPPTAKRSGSASPPRNQRPSTSPSRNTRWPW